MKMRRFVLCVIFAVAATGLLSSCMEIAIRSENWRSLDLYGKVVDQNGMPVVGAKVQGSIGLNISMVESGGKTCYTETDSQGCFHFLHIHGAGIGILPQKEGYYYNQRIPSRPQNYSPDSKNPIVFTMWKIRGAEPVVKSGIDADLSPDGVTATFDITTGKPAADGEFKITLLRVPSEIKSGLVHRFDWKFKIELSKGGLIQQNDPYPYWAPDSGYTSFFEFGVSSNAIPWRNKLDQNFYIRNSAGQYGLMNCVVFSASMPPHAQVSFNINPSGSRNLEPATFP